MGPQPPCSPRGLSPEWTGAWGTAICLAARVSLAIVIPVPLHVGDAGARGNATLSFRQAYLTDFLCQFAQQPCYLMFSGHLSDSERRVLQTIGI